MDLLELIKKTLRTDLRRGLHGDGDEKIDADGASAGARREHA